MTNKFRLFLAAVTVAMLGTSCSEDQTSLTIEEIPGTAKVIGQVSYPTGTEWRAGATVGSGESVETFAIAANKKVIIEVQNSEFKPGAANGITVFETTTDAKGNYEIEVPISGTGSMQVTIKAETFTGEMKEFDRLSTETTPAPIYKTVPVTYSYTTSASVNSTTVTVEDITYTSTPRTLHN